VVEAQDAVVAKRIDRRNDYVLVAGEDRDEIGWRLLVPVCFAGVECGCRGRGIGDVEPLDAVDLGHFAAGGKARRLLARHIIGVLDEHRPVAWLPLLLDEFERPRTDRLRDLLERIGPSEPLGHHKRHVARQLAETVDQQRERKFESDRKALVVDRGNLTHSLHQLLTELVALAPALD
jgi:hypothetical protein